MQTFSRKSHSVISGNESWEHHFLISNKETFIDYFRNTLLDC